MQPLIIALMIVVSLVSSLRLQVPEKYRKRLGTEFASLESEPESHQRQWKSSNGSRGIFYAQIEGPLCRRFVPRYTISHNDARVKVHERRVLLFGE